MAKNGIGENSHTVLRMPMSGPTFYETNLKIPSYAGNTSLSAAAIKFGTHSLKVDAAGDYLSIPASSDFDFGAGPFTIDYWYQAVGDVNTWLWGNMNNYTGGGGGISLEYHHSAQRFQILYGKTNTTYAFSPAYTWHATVGTWYHHAIIRDGNYIHSYIGGVELLPATDVTGISIYPCSRAWLIGTGWYYPTTPTVYTASANAYFAEFRITKGQALWTKNFTPPTRASGNKMWKTGPHWTATTNIPTLRDQATIVETADGNALSFGGWSPWAGHPGQNIATAATDYYDRTTKTWTSKGNMSFSAYGVQAVRFSDGQIFAFGGYTDNGVVASSSSSLYNPSTGTWVSGASMYTPRWAFGSWLLPGDKVLVAGGCSGSGWYSAVADSEIYDHATNIWTSTTPLNQARMCFPYASCSGVPVAIGGGTGPFGSQDGPNYLGNGTSTTSIEAFDIATSGWTTKTTVVPVGGGLEQDGGNIAIELDDGKILWVGGRTTFYGLTASSNSYIYDLNSDSITATGTVNINRVNTNMWNLGNGRILIAGGGSSVDYGGASYISEIYDVSTNTWSYAAPLGLGKEIVNWMTGPMLGDGTALFAGGVAQPGYSFTTDTQIYIP
jgi:hypothetical protein